MAHAGTDTIKYTMTTPVPLGNPLPETPVFGSTEFIGRTRLAKNLFSRCLRRQSILLYGGPKLGKTSMLLHLKWLVDRDREASSVTPASLYLDLSDAVTRTQLLVGPWPSPAPIMLLDDCDHLLKENRIDQLPGFINSASLAHAAVWAGGRSWHDFVQDHRWSANVRHAPLAVLLQGEAEELVKGRLTANQTTAVLTAGGTHPYVLKVLAHHMLSLHGSPRSAVSTASEHLVPFFEACRQALQQGAEESSQASCPGSARR